MRKGGKGAVRLPKILVLIKTAWGHTIAARETVPPVIGSYLQDRLVGLAALSQSSKRFSLERLHASPLPPGYAWNYGREIRCPIGAPSIGTRCDLAETPWARPDCSGRQKP